MENGFQSLRFQSLRKLLEQNEQRAQRSSGQGNRRTQSIRLVLSVACLLMWALLPAISVAQSGSSGSSNRSSNGIDAATPFKGNVPKFSSRAKLKANPNIVFFLVDDLGWTDLGCYGSKFYETPNIDALCKSGMKFNQAYAACQVCSPTRASILTGKYPQRFGVTDYINPSGKNQPVQWNRKTKLLPAPYRDHLPLEEVTIAEQLKSRGYATFFAGKWHLGNKGYWPEDQGFDVNKGGLERGGPYGGKRYFSPYDNERLSDGPEGEHLPDRLATEATQFISANRDNPFLVYLSFYSVHTPLMGREDLVEKYEKLKPKMDESEIWGKEGKRKVRQVQEHAVYAAMVQAMDDAVGKVLDSLTENGLNDNTVVMFMSDNGGLSTSEGYPTSNLPLRGGKGWIYEGGIREPMIVRAPGLTRPGTDCNSIVSSVDFYPTIMELAGMPEDDRPDIDGSSIVDLLRGGEENRKPIFWHYPHYGNQGGSPSAAIRDGDWKLIQWFETGEYSLYNLAKDIGEKEDLAKSDPELVQNLAEKLTAWQLKVGAKYPSKR